MIKIKLNDEEYPFTGFTHVRKVARAIVLDERNRVAIHHIYRDDKFCQQWYYETPGGGVDEGETYGQAIVRECSEEIGCKIEVLSKIGEVEDAYNLIGRKNLNWFYLARRVEEGKPHFASSGDQFIKETLWLPIDEAIARYEAMDDTLVSGLVKRRELPMLKEAKRILADS